MDHSLPESLYRKGSHFCSFEHYFHREIQFLKKKKKGKLRRVNVAVFFFHVLVIFSLPLGKRHNDKAIENIQINLSTDKRVSYKQINIP